LNKPSLRSYFVQEFGMTGENEIENTTTIERRHAMYATPPLPPLPLSRRTLLSL
jgi:hypothetical protein